MFPLEELLSMFDLTLTLPSITKELEGKKFFLSFTNIDILEYFETEIVSV